jgi:hypothetical protein
MVDSQLPEEFDNWCRNLGPELSSLMRPPLRMTVRAISNLFNEYGINAGGLEGGTFIDNGNELEHLLIEYIKTLAAPTFIRVETPPTDL